MRVGCFESAFSLKIRLVLISARATANNDVMLQKGIRTLLGLTPWFIVARVLGFLGSNFAKKNKRPPAV